MNKTMVIILVIVWIISVVCFLAIMVSLSFETITMINLSSSNTLLREQNTLNTLIIKHCQDHNGIITFPTSDTLHCVFH